MTEKLHDDGMGAKGLSLRSFAERHGVSHDLILRYCREGKIFGAKNIP